VYGYKLSYDRKDAKTENYIVCSLFNAAFSNLGKKSRTSLIIEQILKGILSYRSWWASGEI
jgi:hypothetical protein